MPMDVFAMERMQSTWENVVDRDMSESGIRAVTLRELVELGLDLPAMLDTPLGYSQSNGTIALRERIAALYPGATVDHIEVTNGTSEANYLIALSQVRAGDVVAMQVPNYMQMWGVARGLGRNSAELGTALHWLGIAQRARGDFPRAKGTLREALALRRAREGERSKGYTESLSELGDAYRQAGEPDSAEFRSYRIEDGEVTEEAVEVA